jgi:hypothetical protein
VAGTLFERQHDSDNQPSNKTMITDPRTIILLEALYPLLPTTSVANLWGEPLSGLFENPMPIRATASSKTRDKEAQLDAAEPSEVP